jgi:hypothetical protein
MRSSVPAFRIWLIGLLLAAGCDAPDAARLPLSDAARGAPPPRLAPTSNFDAALASASPDAVRLSEESAVLAARAEALRLRAAALSPPVVDPALAPRLAPRAE